MNRRLLTILAVVVGLIALSATVWLPPLRQARRPLPTPSAIPPTPTAKPPASHTVQVTVRDAETAQAIAGAQVQTEDQRDSTNERGMWTIEVVHGKGVRIEVHAPGYIPWSQEIETIDLQDQTFALQVDLEPNAVHGQVVDKEQIPLPHATLNFKGEQVAVDEEGRFTLYRAEVGDVVTAEHEGYQPGQVTYRGDPTLHVALEPHTVTLNVRETLTGQHVAQAVVCADEDHCQPTDRAGRSLLGPVVPGKPLTVTHPSYQVARVPYEGEESLEVALVPTEWHGIVRDIASGQPLSHTILVINDQAIHADEQGRYHLPDLGEADSLLVKCPGYERITIPLTPETTVSQHDALDTCREADGTPCVDIHMQRFAVRGIYVNFNLLWAKDWLLSVIDLVDRSPILNAIVLDIKGDYGYIAFQSTNPVIVAGDAMSSPSLPLEEFLRICKEKEIYTIARMVVFKDDALIAAEPELAVRHPDGTIFYDREGLAWADPTRKEVWEYNIAITKEAIQLGFDEVQYDYLRFPSDSTSLEVVRALVYSVPSTLESRTAAIAGFVTAAKQAVDPTPAFLSADLFGYALVVDPEHDMRIGQRLKDIAPHVDYVCPMIYPSTFIPGNLGLAAPSEHPYEVISISMAYGQERTDTLIRPWLQHYWYERHELAEQKRAAEEATDIGWCYWNAGAAYDELFFIPSKDTEP